MATPSWLIGLSSGIQSGTDKIVAEKRRRMLAEQQAQQQMDYLAKQGEMTTARDEANRAASQEEWDRQFEAKQTAEQAEREAMYGIGDDPLYKRKLDWETQADIDKIREQAKYRKRGGGDGGGGPGRIKPSDIDRYRDNLDKQLSILYKQKEEVMRANTQKVVTREGGAQITGSRFAPDETTVKKLKPIQRQIEDLENRRNQIDNYYGTALGFPAFPGSQPKLPVPGVQSPVSQPVAPVQNQPLIVPEGADPVGFKNDPNYRKWVMENY